MATGPPKRSWRNVAATPPPPKVLFHVDAPEPYYGLTARQEFMARCIGSVYDKVEPIQRRRKPITRWEESFDLEWLNWRLPERRNAQAMGSIIVYYFEQLMLLAMLDPKFPAHIKMKAGFQKLANQLQCNIAVYLGHIETCPAYVETTYKKIIEKEPPNAYPNTIFLIIGCYGNENAYSLNTDPQYKYFQDKNIAFFGFEDFMHFYDGEIYGCKDLLNKKLNIECEYEGNDVDLERLVVDELKEPRQIDTFDETNPLYKCCSAKFERILSTFVKELHSRNTTKYTMEKLYEKFLPFAQSGDRNLLTKEYTTITSDNGVPCNDPVTCPISNPFTTQEAIAKEFNEKALLRILHEELVSYITESSTAEEGHEKLFRRIQNLKGKEKEIFNYRINPSENPYLIELLEKYPRIGSSFEVTSKIMYTLFSFILTKYGDSIDYSMITNGKRNLLQAMIKSNSFSTLQMYTLMKLIFSNIKEEAVRDTLFLNKGVKNGCPLFVEDTILYYQLYIQLFGNKLKDIDYFITAYHKGNLLHKLMSYYISPAEVYKERYEELKRCIIGLLMNGVDPNQKLVIDPVEKAKYNALKTEEIVIEAYKPLELYTALFFPPYSKNIFVSFYKYGMTNENGFLQKQLEKMKSLRDMNESQVHSYEKVLEAIEEYYFYDPNEYEFNYNAYNHQQLGGYRNYYNNNDYNYPYSNNDDYEYLYTRLTSEEKKQYASMTEVYKNFTKQTGFILSSLQYHRMVFKKEIRRPPRVSRVVVNKALFENMIELFNECLRVRRAVGKHGATFRRLRVTNKRNYNQTMKQKFNNLNFNLNPDPIINRLMEAILTLAKKPQLTKQEKEIYKKRPIQIKQSNVDPKEKRKLLQGLLDELEEVLKSR